MKRLALRWLKFNLVGGLGIVVQLVALALLRRWMHYLAATALAVELALLHTSSGTSGSPGRTGPADGASG